MAQTETQTAERTQEKLAEIILGESFDLNGIKPNNTIVIADGRKELVNRIMPFQNNYLVCTLSKTSEGTILEKTYDYVEGALKKENSATNHIEEKHSLYEPLNKLIKEKLGDE